MKIFITTIALSLAFFLSLSGSISRAADAPDKKGAIDWDRARALFEKQQRGEKLSEDEQAYVKRAMAEKAAANANRPAAPAEGGRATRPTEGDRRAPAE